MVPPPPVPAPVPAHGFVAFYQAHSSDIWLGIAFVIVGYLLSEATNWTRRYFRERREGAENQHISIAGRDWFAAWEAAVDDQVVINTEHLEIEQVGARVSMRNLEKSPENQTGGYLWKSALVFSHGETLMGWYYPIKEENITSRGIMYFAYDSQRKSMYGKWVGKSYDGSLCTGFVFIGKDREIARAGVLKLIDMAKRHPVNVLSGGHV